MGRFSRSSWLLLFVALTVSVAFASRSDAQFSQQGNALTFSPLSNAEFGQSVSLSSDGNTAIVGARGETNRSGGAWILTRAGTPPTWSVAAHLTGSSFPGMIGNAWAGYAVAMSANGRTALVGAPLDDNGAGAVWVFRRPGGQWMPQGVKLIDHSTNTNENLGWSVALSRNGATAVIGGPGMEIDPVANTYVYHHGAAYVFSISGSGGALQKILDAGTLADDDATQGWSVGISDDGLSAIVGGPFDGDDRGSAWVYANLTGTGGTPQELGGEFPDGAWAGTSVALSGSGGVALVGGPFEAPYGAARVYSRAGGTWIYTGANLVTNVLQAGAVGGSQGTSVALSADGLTALVGEPSVQPDGLTNNYDDSGRAWLYTMGSSAMWSSPGEQLQGQYVPPTTQLNQFGAQGGPVALSSDGSTAISGAVGENQKKGAAWIFTRNPGSTPNLSQWAQINAPCPGMYFLNGNYTFTANVLKNPFQATPTFKWSLSSPGNVATISSSNGNSVTIDTTPNPPLKSIFGGAQADLCLEVSMGGPVVKNCATVQIERRTPTTNVRNAIAQLNCYPFQAPHIPTLLSSVPTGPIGPLSRRREYSKQDLARIEALAQELAKAAREAETAPPSRMSLDTSPTKK